MHQAVAPSPGFPTDLRRRECLSGAINLGSSVLGAGGTLLPSRSRGRRMVRHELSDIGPDEEDVAARANSCLRSYKLGMAANLGAGVSYC